MTVQGRGHYFHPREVIYTKKKMHDYPITYVVGSTAPLTVHLAHCVVLVEVGRLLLLLLYYYINQYYHFRVEISSRQVGSRIETVRRMYTPNNTLCIT